MLEVLPAVDILGEEAVRLERGDYGRVVARSDPETLAARFAEAGARLVHVVDLDGARSGTVRPELVRRLAAAAAPAAIQFSGGIRSSADAETLLEAGAARVVIGTAAFTGGLKEYRQLGDALVVALDVRDGFVAVRGWQASSGVSVEDAVERCVAAGVRRLLCTAIDRDGTLTGPDVALVRRVVRLSALPVLAAGGVRSPGDLDALEKAGAEAAVVGRALLAGTIPFNALAPRPPGTAATANRRS